VFLLWGMMAAVLLAGCDTGGSPEGDSDENSPPFTSTSVTVESDTLELSGTLFVPDTNASVPGVVIVHGSGLVDRDGPGNPPVYREWATRMARQGIAVLRYDKRTTQPAVRRGDPRAITVLDFVRDAVAAGERLQNQSGVDADRLVLVGHSQGGNVAPAAATRLEGVVGVASLAGPALAIDSLFVAQLEARGGSGPCTADGVRAQFDSLRAGQSISEGLICGAGTTFWRQWIRHSQKMDSVAAALEPPLFVQQGRADQKYPGETLQRTIDAWRRIAAADNTTLRTYDGVGHRFRSPGPIDDLIAWIQDR